MIIREFKTRLAELGWYEDRYGNMLKKAKINGEKTEVRIHFTKLTYRLEKRVTIDGGIYSKDRKTWVKVGGDFMNRVVMLEDGRIQAGKLIFNKPVAKA